MAQYNYIRGEAHWAKILGPAIKNSFDDYHEWTIDVCPDKGGLATIKALGIADRLKDPKSGDKRGDNRYMTFRQKETRADGQKNKPIRVVDSEGKDWPQNVKIGNGSVVDVKFSVKDYGKGKKKGVYIQAIRIISHVPYEGADFAPLSSDDEFFGRAAVAPDSGASPDFYDDFGLEQPTDDLDDVI